MQNPRRTVRTPILAAAVALTVFAAMELVARAVLASQHRGGACSSQGVSGSASCSESGLEREVLKADPDLLWRNRPFVTKTRRVIPVPAGGASEWTLHTNTEGFRGPDREAADPGQDIYRILCLGDSVTLGFNIDQNLGPPLGTYHSLATSKPSER